MRTLSPLHHRAGHTVRRQGLRDHSAQAINRAPAPQEQTGTGVSPNDELVNTNGPNAPHLGIKLGGCIHSERYYIASSIHLLLVLTERETQATSLTLQGGSTLLKWLIWLIILISLKQSEVYGFGYKFGSLVIRFESFLIHFYSFFPYVSITVPVFLFV